MSELSADRALIARTAAGDRRAWDQLRNRHSLLLFAYACDTLGDPEQAEEIVTETLQEAWCSAAEFDLTGDRDPASWLLGLARGICRRAIDAEVAGTLPVLTATSLHSLRTSRVDRTASGPP